MLELKKLERIKEIKKQIRSLQEELERLEAESTEDHAYTCKGKPNSYLM